MRTYLETCFLLAIFTVITTVNTDTTVEDCGDVQYNVENGIIRLPDFPVENIKDINCSWTYVAPPSRKLLVKVDSVHLPPSDIRSSVFQLYVDDQLYDIPRNCVKCLKEIVGGKTIKVLFTSLIVSSDESKEINATEIHAASVESIGYFQVRYKSFDPYRCSKPEQIENGYIVSKGRKLGQNLFYRCNPPYDIFGESEVQCVISQNSPVPEWNNKPPKCGIQDCNNDPVVRETSGSIASPGFPIYMYNFTSPCQWIIKAHSNQQIKVSITFLELPKHSHALFADNSSRLSLIDGDLLYLVNLTESLTNGPLNFTAFSGELTVEFIVSDEDNKRKEEIGFYLDYSILSNSCYKPKAPVNGEVISYSNEMGSVVAFKCDKGFVLVGELHAECLLNGQWSHTPPTCEALRAETPFLIEATNDSDTVVTKISETSTLNSKSDKGIEFSKPFRSGKKKLNQKSLSVNSKEEPEEDPNSKGALTFDIDKSSERNGKKYNRENGPKSEPHLFQVIPPKNNVEKTTGDSLDTGWPMKPNNFSKHAEQLPDPSEDLNRSKTKRYPVMTVTMIAIVAGIGAPITVAVIILIAIVIYRRRYPVRMRFGRKFSTFENPMYVSKDAHHPRELKRLTT